MIQHVSSRIARRRQRDDGSVLILTLAFLAITGLTVVAMLTWVSTVIRVRPPLQERTSVSESVRSGIRMAINQQRVHGPDSCYDDSQTTYLNSYTVTITCVVDGTPDLDNPMMRGRYGVITTSNNRTLPALYGTGTGEVKPIEGDVFVNAGQLQTDTADIAIADTLYGTEYLYPSTPDIFRYEHLVPTVGEPCSVAGVGAYGIGMNCGLDPWDTVAGHDPDGLGWVYPDLPPVPTQGRSATHILDIGGGCTVYFPGRYTSPLTINGGTHYFASGVYMFEAPLTVTGDARVVFGEGRYGGCALDATAALFRDNGPPVVEAPKNHAITGKGATLLLADNATLNVVNASVRINRRLSTPSTRATENMAIRTVHTSAIQTADLTVPADQVMIAPGDEFTPPTREPASTHSVSSITYRSTTAGWNDVVVSADFRGGSTTNNELVADGAVFVPGARMEVLADDPNYVLKIDGGIVASRVGAAMTQLPSAASENYVLGARPGIIQSKFRFQATIIDGLLESHSTAELQLHQNGSYAVNNWTLDLAGQGSGGPSTTAGPTTTVAPTTTLPLPTTTVSGPTTSTSSTTSTTTTTTLPPIPAIDYCTVNSGSYTFDFGPGSWDAEYYDNRFLTGTPVLSTSSQINYDWGGGGPAELSTNDNFSVRWTRTINLAATCRMQFRLGGDDGYRLFLDGTEIIDDWSAHSYRSSSARRTLSPGLHTIVVEFYEQGGQARATLRWRERW